MEWASRKKMGKTISRIQLTRERLKTNIMTVHVSNMSPEWLSLFSTLRWRKNGLPFFNSKRLTMFAPYPFGHTAYWKISTWSHLSGTLQRHIRRLLHGCYFARRSPAKQLLSFRSCSKLQSVQREKLSTTCSSLQHLRSLFRTSQLFIVMNKLPSFPI